MHLNTLITCQSTTAGYIGHCSPLNKLYYVFKHSHCSHVTDMLIKFRPKKHISGYLKMHICVLPINIYQTDHAFLHGSCKKMAKNHYANYTRVHSMTHSTESRLCETRSGECLPNINIEQTSLKIAWLLSVDTWYVEVNTGTSVFLRRVIYLLTSASYVLYNYVQSVLTAASLICASETYHVLKARLCNVDESIEKT